MKSMFKLFKNFQVVGKFSLNGPFILMFTRELGEGNGRLQVLLWTWNAKRGALMLIVTSSFGVLEIEEIRDGWVNKLRMFPA